MDSALAIGQAAAAHRLDARRDRVRDRRVTDAFIDGYALPECSEPIRLQASRKRRPRDSLTAGLFGVTGWRVAALEPPQMAAPG